MLIASKSPDTRKQGVNLRTARKFQEKLASAETFSRHRAQLDLKLAVAALEGAIHKVAPWNMATFKTLSVFLTTMDFGKAELRGKDSRLSFLADFIDEVIRANAQQWDERKPAICNQKRQAHD